MLTLPPPEIRVRSDRYDGAMSAFDKAKDAADKVDQVTEDAVDKLDDVIEKIADKVDEKTDGKYSDRIDHVVDAVQNPAEATARDDEPPSPPAP